MDNFRISQKQIIIAAIVLVSTGFTTFVFLRREPPKANIQPSVSATDYETAAKTLDPVDPLYATIQNTFGKEFEEKYINARLTHQAITEAMLSFARSSENAEIRKYASQVQSDLQSEATKLRQFAKRWNYEVTRIDNEKVSAVTLSLKNQTGQQRDRQFATDIIDHLSSSTRMAQLAVVNPEHQEIKDEAEASIAVAQKRDEPFFRWASQQGYLNNTDELSTHSRHDG